MKIRKIHPAFAQPDRSLRRKMSEKMAMKIQIAITQKNNTSIVHRTLPTFHSVASTVATPFDGCGAHSSRGGLRCTVGRTPREPYLDPRGSQPEPLGGCHHLAGAANLERHHDLADAV